MTWATLWPQCDGYLERMALYVSGLGSSITIVVLASTDRIRPRHLGPTKYQCEWALQIDRKCHSLHVILWLFPLVCVRARFFKIDMYSSLIEYLIYLPKRRYLRMLLRLSVANHRWAQYCILTYTTLYIHVFIYVYIYIYVTLIYSLIWF